MIRKLWFYLVALILVAAAIVAIVIAAKNSKSHDDKASNSTVSTTIKNTQTPKKACDIFDLADAKQLLGDSAKGGDNSSSESSADLAVSTCTYTQDSGSNTPIATSNSASLLVRTPKTNKGATSNQNEFGALKPVGVQDVSGYGDKAYWDAEHGQLNILKNSKWYILSYGPTTPATRTLDQAKQLADILINEL